MSPLLPSSLSLGAQLHHRDRRTAALLRFRVNAFHQRMRRKKFRQAPPQCARSVTMNHTNLRLAGERGVINKFVHSPGSFLDRAPNDVDLIDGAAGFAIRGSRMYGDPAS